MAWQGTDASQRVGNGYFDLGGENSRSISAILFGEFDCDRSSACVPHLRDEFCCSAVTCAGDCFLAVGNGYRSIRRC